MFTLPAWGYKVYENGTKLTDAENQNIFPEEFNLSQNFPNPFNPVTKIKFTIAEEGLVTLKVYNLLGQQIATLLNNELKSGAYNVDFNGTNLSSGVYFYTIRTNSYSATKKMILLK